jgi:hypothetical protein
MGVMWCAPNSQHTLSIPSPAAVQSLLVDLLTDIEVRVLGSLIEKDITTPDYYPLSLNALINACNQKNNRDPVMILNEDSVSHALATLQEKRLAGPASGADSRVTKYEHRLQEVFNFDRREIAILCVLLLLMRLFLTLGASLIREEGGQVIDSKPVMFGRHGLEWTSATFWTLYPKAFQLLASIWRGGLAPRVRKNPIPYPHPAPNGWGRRRPPLGSPVFLPRLDRAPVSLFPNEVLPHSWTSVVGSVFL